MHQTVAPDQRGERRVPVDMLLNKYVGGTPHLARASNLSRHGLLVHRLFEPANNDAKVQLQFQLPDTGEVISCGGRVVYRHPWHKAQGVAFTNLSREQQNKIDAFINRQ